MIVSLHMKHWMPTIPTTGGIIVTSKAPISVAIVEDNRTIREGLALLLGNTDGVDCVGQFGNCEDMLARTADLQPNLILMDIGLPGMTGIEGTKALQEQSPDTVVLVLSVYQDEDNIFDALCAGASGYLIKNTPPERLVEAIHEAHAGGSPMSAQIARKVVTVFQTLKAPKPAPDAELSEREVEVLTGLSNGQSYHAVAESIYVSVDTVRYHIRNIYKKLHVHSQSAAVAQALRRGLI
jgi:DNA-binding NarL/FixJ family response regulator